MNSGNCDKYNGNGCVMICISKTVTILTDDSHLTYLSAFDQAYTKPIPLIPHRFCSIKFRQKLLCWFVRWSMFTFSPL